MDKHTKTQMATHLFPTATESRVREDGDDNFCAKEGRDRIVGADLHFASARHPARNILRGTGDKERAHALTVETKILRT